MNAPATATLREDLPAAAASAAPVLSIRELTYSFARRGKVLDAAALDIRPGERVALVGDNGAGKTTLLHLIVGLYKARQGSIRVLDQDCREEADFVKIRPRAGFLFQDPDDQLFCPTVLEDVCFGPQNQGLSDAAAREIALQALDGLGMAAFAERITHQLSGGEKRMITLASVLAMQPELLLLDEPSNALDGKARKRLIETLQALPQAMLIISHERAFLEALATRWVLLRDGKLLPTTPDEYYADHVPAA